MDNFSVIASIMLFGLFLIASPSEGYVVGYIDFSDQKLQSSLFKRQVGRIMNTKRPEPEIDGGIIFNSGDQEPLVDYQLYPNNEYDNSINDISSNHVAAENQNGGTSQNDGEFIFRSDDRKAEDERMKKGDIMLADAPPKNENANNVPGPNTILYVKVTSSSKL